MPVAELRVLGRVEVIGDHGPIRLAPKHTRLLVALLVADGSACSVDELVEAVWHRSPPASARKLTRVYVSQLRKVLPAEIAIDTQHGAYAVSVEPNVVDARRFERLLREAIEARENRNPALALSLAERALALWRGRAYRDLAYDDLARAESERLEELRLDAIEEQLDARLALGRHSDALGEALAHAGTNAFRERAHELAMLALYRSGRQADALDHYTAMRTRLDDDLGLEPGPALRELQGRILRQDPQLDLAAAGSDAGVVLPIPPNPLVGRERELEELRALLERRESRLVVLTGAGGSGKTRLALEIAREVAGSYANGVVRVELAPLRDPALVAPTIAHGCEISDVPDDGHAEAVVAALAPLELLLLLDNAEHLREASMLYSDIVARCPRVTILVTSRAVLHVSGEHVFPVAPLPESDAVELFTQRARSLYPTFALSSENEADVRHICRRVDGLPLAIELAAARIRTLTPHAIRNRLGARLALLTGGPRDLPARQQTLRETIDWSVDLLGERERHAFARLAVFPGGATLEAAEVVCDADFDTLAALVDEHLVRRDDVAGDPRFGLLETIREYALELLADERAETERALAVYLVRFLDHVGLRGPAFAQWMQHLDGELDNFRASLDFAVSSGDTALELALAGGLWRYWWIRGSLAEGLERIELALARPDRTPTRERARALAGAAGLAWSQGDLRRANELASQAVPVAKAAGALWEESQAHVVLGVAANTAEDWTTARSHLERAVAIAEQLGVEPLTEKMNLGVVALDSGDYGAAAGYFEDVLTSHRRDGTVEGAGFALLNLGVVRRELGDHEASRRDFEGARDAFEEIGFRAHVAHALQGLAAYEVVMGRHKEAARLLGRASAELDELGWLPSDFAPELSAEVEAAARAELGDKVFEDVHAAGANV